MKSAGISQRTWVRSIFAANLILCCGSQSEDQQKQAAAAVQKSPPSTSTPPAQPQDPTFRVVAEGWGEVQISNIQAVLSSAMQELWRYFPQRKLEPIVVMRGREGPIVHFQRNLRGEIIMNLDTQGTYWSQYAYQVSHEFCHVLAGFDDDWKGNLWFEETLCETASLFALRHMAETWKTSPPYPNWKSYSSALQGYVADVIKSREVIPAGGLPEFYEKHAAQLQSTPNDRAVNGAMAVVMLDLFEREPARWESLTWLNSSPSRPGETFQEYLLKWQRAVPQRHKEFIAVVMKKFGLGS